MLQQVQVYCGEDFQFLQTLTRYMPLARPVTMLDAGTNVGLAAILLAQAMRFHGQIVAVDANPGTLEVRRVQHKCSTVCRAVQHSLQAVAVQCVRECRIEP
jgi:predicted O-methyltransferase YrrM